jgi:hypothetical protein
MNKHKRPDQNDRRSNGKQTNHNELKWLDLNLSDAFEHAPRSGNDLVSLYWRRCLARLSPEAFGGGQGVNFDIFPPLQLVALTVNFSVMGAAKRHGKLIADFSPQCTRLSKAQVVRIGWPLAAHQAGLTSDKF